MRRNQPGSTGTLAKVRQALQSLKGTGNKLAAFILADPDRVAYLPITELAERSGVSLSAVVRFCRALGFSGYQEFRIALAQDVVDTVFVELEDIGEQDDIATVMQKVLQANLQAIQDTTQLTNTVELQRAADALRGARRVSIHAAGPSYAIAWVAFTRLIRIGIPATAHTELHTQMVVAGHLGPGDVALGISHGGNSIGTVEPLRTARAQGATTICITRFARSPLTETSDIALYTASHDVSHPMRGRASRTAMMFLLDLLFALVTRDLDASDAGPLKRSRDAIERLRGVAIRAPDKERAEGKGRPDDKG